MNKTIADDVMEAAGKGQGKHTPGPWAVNFPGSADIIADFGGNDISVATIDGPKDQTHHLVHEEHQANARLIAAAPELLEACKKALKDNRMQADSSLEVEAILLAAISKAEGRS